VSEPTAEELRAAAERDETEARLLEQALDRLDPSGRPYARRLGIELPALRSDDDLGRAQYAAELARGRRDYLAGRYQELSTRAAQRERYATAAALGIDRFTGEGRRPLDELLEPEREIRRARWEAAGR
jgi:hypothetical protein